MEKQIFTSNRTGIEMIVWGENGHYKVTTLANYNCYLMDARKVSNIADCENIEEATDCAKMWM